MIIESLLWTNVVTSTSIRDGERAPTNLSLYVGTKQYGYSAAGRRVALAIGDRTEKLPGRSCVRARAGKPKNRWKQRPRQ